MSFWSAALSFGKGLFSAASSATPATSVVVTVGATQITAGQVRNSFTAGEKVYADARIAFDAKFKNFDDDMVVAIDVADLVSKLPIPEVNTYAGDAEIALEVTKWVGDNGKPAQPEDPAMTKAAGPDGSVQMGG